MHHFSYLETMSLDIELDLEKQSNRSENLDATHITYVPQRAAPSTWQFSWKNISYSKKEKQILENISGTVEPGTAKAGMHLT